MFHCRVQCFDSVDVVPGFICLTVKWKEIDLSADKYHQVGYVLRWRSVDSLQSMVEGTEERLHRKAVLEQSPGDMCVS